MVIDSGRMSLGALCWQKGAGSLRVCSQEVVWCPVDTPPRTQPFLLACSLTSTPLPWGQTVREDGHTVRCLSLYPSWIRRKFPGLLHRLGCSVDALLMGIKHIDLSCSSLDPGKETPSTCIPHSAGREREESIALHILSA